MYDFNGSLTDESDSVKWNQYPADVIPMGSRIWISDPHCGYSRIGMCKHGIFGYGIEEPGLREAFVVG